MLADKLTYHSPADVAHELTMQHIAVSGCMQCGDGGELCLWHDGYREGMTVLLIKASVNR
jgi:hypothetical protein